MERKQIDVAAFTDASIDLIMQGWRPAVEAHSSVVGHERMRGMLRSGFFPGLARRHAEMAPEYAMEVRHGRETAFMGDRKIAAAFQTLPGASFVVNGAAPASNAALTTASAEIKWLDGVSLSATFEGEFSAVTRSYAGKGVARYSW